MKRMLKKIYVFGTKPYTDYFIFLLLVFCLVTIPNAIASYCLYDVGVASLLWEITHCYLLSYLAILLMSNISSRKLSKVGMAIVLILAIIDFTIETTCLVTTGAPFNEDIVAIIMATNIAEVYEFVIAYFSIEVVFILVCVFLLILGTLRFVPRITISNNKVLCLLLIFTLSSFLYFEIKGTESYDTKFYNKIPFFLSYELPPDLRQYKRSLEIELSKPDTPQYVLLILGESFAKSHSSLYGYEKETNPRLSRMRDSSMICVFEDVVAPSTNTIPCVKSIMSTYRLEYKDSVKWYECVTLPQIMSELGYMTAWISNQSPSGVYDNVAARYAELCDTAIWVGSKVMGVSKEDLDGNVLKVFDDRCVEGKSFIIVHLMGSHCSFASRYSKDYEIFTPSDYVDLPENQRKILAEYDNSILYNDFVVSEILNRFADKECLAFYFSDHSLDLFESDPSYYGYARLSNSRSLLAALSIPYMIYGSPIYQAKYSQEWDTIKLSVSIPRETDNTIEHIAEILGVQISY